MHILLININPVVSRLISLCAREEHIELEEVHCVSDVARDKYDVVFVDEASYVNETQEVLDNLIIRKKVFLSSRDESNEERGIFDSMIRKPFLPSQIIAVLKSLQEDEILESNIEIPSIFPLSSDNEKSMDKTVEKEEAEDTKVLDSNEIEKIKALLETEEEITVVEEIDNEKYESRKREVIKQQLIDDGLEIVDEDEYLDVLNKTSKKKKKKKSKKNKEAVFTFEEALLAAIEGMKVKKIKKLLKGAEVTIKINFKDKK